MKRLIDILKSSGKDCSVFDFNDGTRVLMLPYGGRVLGLFAPHSEENFYWTNPALSSSQTAIAFFASQQWQNTGGDRTWLAPEIDVFFPDFPKLDKYFQPRQMDPGNFRKVECDGYTEFINTFSILMSRSKKTVDLELTKSVGPAPNPLRYERGLPGLGDVSYAGYTQYTCLKIRTDAPESADQVGLWNLVQMPHGGEMLFPTFVRTQPLHIFSTIGTIGPEDLTINDHLVRYRMCAKGEHKIALRALPTAGRIGYYYQDANNYNLIIRNFYTNPSGEYIDVPWTDTEYQGFSLQACNVNSGLGSFSELEYHIPAIGKGTGKIECNDESVVWAFRGSLDSIRAICRSLLTPEF